jgi:predicted transcriptional regulator of viral defense system
MDDNLPGQYGVSDGVALAQALATAGLYIFATEDAVRLAPTGVAPTRVPYLLKMLADAGWIVRLRRGLYAGTGQLPGGVDVPAPVLARALVSPSALAHWSALAYHDLTDQVPVVVTLITPKKVVTPSMRGAGSDTGRHVWRVAGIECRFVTVSEKRYGIGLEWAWFDQRFRASITDRERTVLDLFAMPSRFGGIGEGIAVLDRAGDTLDIPKLVEYALRYGEIAAAKRLGWALERSGVATTELRPLLELPAVAYSPLDPGRSRRGGHDRRWMLTLNQAGPDSHE